MPVTLTACVVVFSILYLRKVEADFVRESIWLGVIWLAISIAIDLGIFMWGPMKMSLANYLQDIGLTYLVFPIVTTGFGCLLARKRGSA
jgi:EamA domain-containing membrane protein RarD